MEESYSYRPELFGAGVISGTKREVLLSQGVRFYDTLYRQVEEYIKITFPQKKWVASELNQAVTDFFKERGADYGVWAYFPWRREAVLILEEEEFIRLRTSRNQYKITPEEQRTLKGKTIGIIGLSVGHSIALTLASERTCGTLRLTDFDTLDLSNLNRIRTSLVHLGFPKVVLAAREIAEIDPYLKVEVFQEGFQEAHAETFVKGLDLLIEECDSLEIKILARETARAHRVPVLMDTSDSGMMDVERFDLEPSRPLMHGLLGQLGFKDLKGMSKEEKLPITLKLAGIFQLSHRLKASMLEIDQTITTWPQLASDVTSGAGQAVMLSRKILLGHDVPSGRKLDQELPGAIKAEPLFIVKPEPLSQEIIQAELGGNIIGSIDFPENALLERWVDLANMAPSGGNCQPWKWVYQSGLLHLFHEPHFSESLLDYTRFGSYLALGAAIYNLELSARADGFESVVHWTSEGMRVASVQFRKVPPQTHTLLPFIPERQTYRNKGTGVAPSAEVMEQLRLSVSGFHQARLDIYTDRSLMSALGAISACGERWRVVNRQGHHDTFHEELRWTVEETESTRDGIDVRTLGMSDATIKAFELAKDYLPVKFLREQGLAKVFEKGINDAVKNNGAACLLYMEGEGRAQFLQGGRVFEHVWLEAARLGLSFQPVSAFLFLFRLLEHTDISSHITAEALEELTLMKQAFLKLTGKNHLPIFMFCIGDAPPHEFRSLRRKPKKSILILE